MPLFQVHPLAARLGVFEPAKDGQRFLVYSDMHHLVNTPLNIVTNWDAEISNKSAVSPQP